MPKLCNFADTVGGVGVGYTMHEDTDGNWHAVLSMRAKGEDAIDAANKIAVAMREVAKTPPEHSPKCVCLLCEEWKLHNSTERLGG